MMTQTKNILASLDLDKIKPVQFLEVTSKHLSTLEQAIVDATANNIDVTYDSLMEITHHGEYVDDYPDACIFYEHVDALRIDMENHGIKFVDGLKICIKNFIASGSENAALVLKVATLLTDLCNGAYKLHNSIELRFAIEARACLFMLGCISTKDSGVLVYDHASFIEEVLNTHQGCGVGSWTALTTISALAQTTTSNITSGFTFNFTDEFVNNHYTSDNDIDLLILTSDLVLERDSDYDGVQYDTLYVLEP